MNVITDDYVLALATAYVNQGDPRGVCVATSVKSYEDGELTIEYSYPSGNSSWCISMLVLMAWGWNNPKV